MTNENENWYNEEIAPKLLEIANLCKERGMAFISVAECALYERSTTTTIPAGSGLAMAMLHQCAKYGDNVDGYIMWLKRYTEEHGIDTSGSFLMSLIKGEIDVQNNWQERKMEWQPIETAPKDGTEILCVTTELNMYVVSYDADFDAPWRVVSQFGFNEHIPTHWMPLPETPVLHI